MGGVRAGPKATASTGLEFRALHPPSNAVPTHFEASSPQLPMDAWSSIEGAVLLKNRCHLCCDGSVLLGTGNRIVLPLLGGVEAAAGHTQLPVEPGNGKTITECADQAKLFGGSCSTAKCAAASLKKSFSLLSSRFSLHSRLSSARSSLVSWP